jgi:co-chaperonin GroES (HSP10)
MSSDPTVQANGPWVFVKVDRWPTMTPGGLYIPDGNMEERMGVTTGRVISTGKGKLAKNGLDLVPTGVKPGDKIVFRGFLQEANRHKQFDYDDCCFLHQDDIMGVMEE